jgi:hypothetical protein
MAAAMSAPAYLLNAPKRLDALALLLQVAAAQHRPVDEIIEPALTHLREARQIIDATMDEEGTE